MSLLYQTLDLLSRSLAHIKNETNSHQERHNFPNFALSASNRRALGKRGMPTQVKSGCGSQHSHRLRLRLAGRGPNNSSLHPPLAAVAVVAGHSIARPIACGNRVPPQRTLALGISVCPECPANRIKRIYNAKKINQENIKARPPAAGRGR